jgi:signal transduction histidine kinase
MEDEDNPVVRAARTHEIVFVEDLDQEPEFDLREFLPEAKAQAIIPLISGDHLLGVSRLFQSRPFGFHHDDVMLFRSLSTQIATALSRARYVEELQETARRLQELDRLKSEFLANMSHELRTPLNSVIGYAEMILMGVDGELNDDMREDVQAIYENGQHLLSMINDILDLAKIEAGRMSLDIHPLDLRPIMEDIASSAEGLLQKHGSSVKLEVVVEDNLPLVPADPLRLHQVLNNLVSNAVKFTEEGHIRVHARREGQWAVISVEDTGAGIPEEAREIIFEKFRQADGSYTRKAQGTGLGLAITRSLVEMHGGTLTLESEVGKGSTFTIHLPLYNRDQGGEGKAS